MTKNKKTTKKAKKTNKNLYYLLGLVAIFLLVLLVLLLCHRPSYGPTKKDANLDNFKATPFLKVAPLAKPQPKAVGISPASARSIYRLGTAGGSGTIAIVDAYDSPTAEADLGAFSRQYSLRACTTANNCFEKHKMRSSIAVSPDWAMEIALDVQWAHAIAPNAKVLLVEAASNSGSDLLAAVDYARKRSDVVAVSLSWGGAEFNSEVSYESYFTSSFGATFFASSGDSGNGVSWPAVSANVVGVGGTTLRLNTNGTVASETAWSGSGGGLSKFVPQPAFQKTYNVPNASNKRAVPDVSYNADPATGYPVYDTTSYFGQTGWFLVGGTSAGAPQWAAIASINKTAKNTKFYVDAKSANRANIFRDITTGKNGNCGFYCNTAANYDYVTGLGSPLTVSF